MDKVNITISKMAQKQLSKAPVEIIEAVQKWVYSIEEIGIEETRKIGGKGLHDEPLKGELKSFRSIRLNRAWRLYYSIINGEPRIVNIERIDKHEY